MTPKNKSTNKPATSSPILHVVLAPESQVEVSKPKAASMGITDLQRALLRVPRRSWLVVGLVAGLLLISAFYYYKHAFAQAFPQHVFLAITNNELDVSIIYPEFISTDTTRNIDVSITNLATQTVTGSITVVFSGTLPVQIQPATTNVVELQDLRPGEKKRQLVDFMISDFTDQWRLFSPEVVNVSLRFNNPSLGNIELISRDISLAPIPTVPLKVMFTILASLAALMIAPLAKFVAESIVIPYVEKLIHPPDTKIKQIPPKDVP